MARIVRENPMHPADVAGRISDNEWQIYASVIDAAIAAGIPFALGGAFALAVYTRVWRNTKDLDLYILPQHRERMIALLSGLGLTDYYDKVPYDRQWIYRATTDGVIVDLIWAMANHRAKVDATWITGPEVHIRGRAVKVLRPESILWDKLYIMQRERCDWPDVMNLLYEQGPQLDWEEVLARLDNDTSLLAGALSVFRWLAPGIARRLPQWLWKRVDVPPPAGQRLSRVDRRRAALLDSRPWFAQTKERRGHA